MKWANGIHVGKEDGRKECKNGTEGPSGRWKSNFALDVERYLQAKQFVAIVIDSRQLKANSTRDWNARRNLDVLLDRDWAFLDWQLEVFRDITILVHQWPTID